MLFKARGKLLLLLAGALLLAPLFVENLNAQVLYGSVFGTVTDQTGAVVPGATVTIVNTQTGYTREATSDATGRYNLQNVLEGKYDLSVKMTGFRNYLEKGINVSINTVTQANISLQVGQVTETVTVTAQGATVQTASSERSGTITTAQVENLAIRGRNVTALAKLLPGVVLTGESDQVDIGNNIRALGGRSTMNNVSLDGVPMNDIGNNNGYSVYVSMDAVSEVKILLGNYAAEYGRLAGANVQMVTKSGTRDFHGLVSYFKRHEQFNATNFFNNRLGARKPRYRFNTWNYSIGGPIYIPGKFAKGRDKLFFFWSQEFWPIRSNGALNTVTVPTALERAGDFSQSVDLNSARINIRDPTNGQPFAGNMVPAGRIDASGQALRSGIYFLRMRGDGFQRTQKLVVAP